MKDKDYLITGRPFTALTAFVTPIIIGSLFQQFYTMVDSAVVGRFVSEKALGAVGASYALTNVFIMIAAGGGIGASVVVSRHFGERRYGQMKTAASTAMIGFLVMSCILGLFGLLYSRRIMIWLQTPDDVLDMAAEYLGIYFLGLPFMCMYNVLSSMFNGLGHSREPLIFLIFSSLLNIVLDLLFVVHWSFGVAGAAWATLIAQGISAVLSFAVFVHTIKGMHDDAETKMRFFSRAELGDITKIALPSILQMSTVSIGMMLVQSVVNRFGSEALAGFSAAMRIESICVVPMQSLGTALSSYTAQNIGAGRNDRVVQGYHVTNRLVIFFAVIICLALELGYHGLISLFLGSTGTETAYATGEGYLRFMGWFFCMIGFKMSVDGLLRGAGDVKMFTIANLANLSVRVAVAFIFAPLYGIHMVWVAVPIGWTINFIISYAQYRTGKWSRIYQAA